MQKDPHVVEKAALIFAAAALGWTGRTLKQKYLLTTPNAFHYVDEWFPTDEDRAWHMLAGDEKHSAASGPDLFRAVLRVKPREKLDDAIAHPVTKALLLVYGKPCEISRASKHLYDRGPHRVGSFPPRPYLSFQNEDLR